MSKRWILIAAAGLLAAAYFSISTEGLKVGTAAPSVEVKSQDGQTVKLADEWMQNGALIVFWSPTCHVCIGELPKLVQIAKKSSFPVILISDEIASVPLKILYDADYAAARAFEVSFIPQAFWINKQGIITAKASGALSE